MKRYKYYNTLEFRNLVEHHDGDYVLYSDHKQTVDELVGALEAAIDTMETIGGTSLELNNSKDLLLRRASKCKAAIDKYRESGDER